MHAAAVNGGRESSWKDSYKTAAMITLPDVCRICGEEAGQLVQDLARGAGCPEEFILMPLLSCCSALLGHRSEIRVHSAWSEPPVLWMIVGAVEGTRKSAALRQVLVPLLALTDGSRQQKQQEPVEQQLEQQDPVHLGTHLPNVYTCCMDMQQLRRMLHEGGGGVLHVTERLEDSHRSLEMHAMLGEDLKTSRAQLHDLYEAFAGRLALPPAAVNKTGVNEPFALLSQTVCYNQCGFATPEYVVNLTVKAPNWLSGRFLVSCPAVDENNFTRFDIPLEDSSDDEESSHDSPRAKKLRKAKKLSLKDVYVHMARVHSQNTPLRYVFTKEAVRELQRFQEEEWCTIVNQLGGEDSGGLVGKSLGQIVRLAGVLKALSVASKYVLENSTPLKSEEVRDESIKIKIDSEDVGRAIELGKYFLEQKLSMTFMVSTGFFRSSCSSRQSQESVPPPPAPQSSADLHFMPTPNPINSLYGFPKLASMNPPSSTMSVGGMPIHSTISAQQPSPQHPQPRPATSLPTSVQNHNFPFNLLPGHQAPGFPLISGRGNNLPSLPPTSASMLVPPSPSSNASPEIDVSQLPATWIPATPEEEMAEMSQAAEFAQLEPSQFVAVHARRVKRLLECFDDGCGVSATTAAQKSIAPPVRVAGTNNRHPAWASALFFQKVADLGLGIAEQVRHPTNGRVYWRFKRKPTSELTEKNFQLLQYLRIDMVRYSRLGQPTLNVPGLELEAVPDIGEPERSIADAEGRNSGGKGNNNSPPVVVTGIKQELILD